MIGLGAGIPTVDERAASAVAASFDIGDSLRIWRYAGVDVRTVVIDGDPPLRGVEKHVYAVEIVGVGVKIGITEFPAKRLAAHARAARDHGHTVGMVALTEAHENARENERTLKRLGGPSNRSEYLRVPFVEITDIMRTLPIKRADAAEHAARAEHVANVFKGLLFGGTR